MSQTATPVLAPEIMSVLGDVARPLFTAQGLTDEEVSGLLISSTNSNPLHQLSQRLETYVNNFFVLEMGGTETAEQLLAEGKCQDVSGGIVEQFPITPSEKKARRVLELVNLGREVNDGEVTALYGEPGCETPSYEAGLRFAIKFPEVQRSRVVVFRPEPLWQGRDRGGHALFLDGDAFGRIVGSDDVGPEDRWAQRCWFARFRRFE